MCSSDLYSQAGSYNVTFTVSDGSLTASETITITVNNVNRPPVLNAIGAKSVSENQTLSFTISGSDPDGDAITFSATGLPTGASFDSGTRTFTWTPTFTQASTYNVSFTVSDGSLTASEVVTITVAHVNRAPVMTVPGPQTVVAGQPLTFSVSATDPDGDPLTFGATGLPSGATFDTGTRQFTWTPIDSQAGSVSVTFTASDGQLTSSGNVAITVTATATTNSPPALALPDSLNGAATFALSSTITATDPDGDALTFSSADLPAGASLAANGALSWTPNAGQIGVFMPTITVSDGRANATGKLPIFIMHPDYDWLVGAKLFAYRNISDKVFVYAFKRPDRTSIVFAWTATGYSYPLASTGMTQMDLLGNPTASTTLGSTPVLFLSDKRVSARQALDRVVAAIAY